MQKKRGSSTVEAPHPASRAVEQNLPERKHKSTRSVEAPAVTVTLDYPQDGEIITSPNYTFRIGAKEAGNVEVSIDGEAWTPCRQAEGYWWYDWSGYDSGIHEILARVQPQDGLIAPPAKCRFQVELPAF